MPAVTRNRPRRIRRKRVFLVPSVHTKATFTSLLAKESKNIINNSVWIRKHVTKPIHLRDLYTKDSGKTCPNKNSTNMFLCEHVYDNDTCLVLDGPKARTSKCILKTTSGCTIDVPNNSDSIKALRKFSKQHSEVTPHAMSLNEFVNTTRKRYNVMYLDTCGFYITGQDSDLKATIEHCFYRNLLIEGGIFGVTVTKRTNGTNHDVETNCTQWVIEQNPSLRCVKRFSYGSMITLFFQDPKFT